MLPLLLYELEKKMQKYPILWHALKFFIVLLTWSFVYIVISWPFLLFFEADNTEWLKDNGFEIFDWSEDN